MKKLAIVLFCLSTAFSLNAQTDTLDQFWKQPVDTGILISPNGGWVSGTNGYGDREKLQAFFNTRTFSVLGALVWIARLDTISGDASASNTWLKLRRLDITTTTTAPFIRGPRETIDSVAFPLSVLTAGNTPETGLNWLPFPTPVLVNQPFTMGLTVFEGIQNDTLALMHSEPDSVGAAGQSWELYNGRFRRMIDSWGLNVDFAIFPVIDTTLNNLNKPLETKTLSVFPNPGDHCRVQLESAFENRTIRLIDLAGRIVFEQKIPPGIDSVLLELPELSAGLYAVVVQDSQSIASALWKKTRHTE